MGEIVTLIALSTFPFSGTLILRLELSATSRDPLKLPVVVGSKATATASDCPGWRGCGSVVFPTENADDPETEILSTVIGELPEFCTLNVC